MLSNYYDFFHQAKWSILATRSIQVYLINNPTYYVMKQDLRLFRLFCWVIRKAQTNDTFWTCGCHLHDIKRHCFGDQNTTFNQMEPERAHGSKGLRISHVQHELQFDGSSSSSSNFQSLNPHNLSLPPNPEIQFAEFNPKADNPP